MSSVFGKTNVNTINVSELERIITEKCMQAESTSVEVLMNDEYSQAVTCNSLTRVYDVHELLEVVRDELERRGLVVVCATSWCDNMHVYVIVDPARTCRSRM